MKPHEKRRRTLLAKFGSEAALREHYREMKRRSMLNPNNQKGNHRGGFNIPAVAKKAGELGRATRYGQLNEGNQNADIKSQQATKAKNGA